MFSRSTRKDARKDPFVGKEATLLSGGLPTFSPSTVARAARRDKSEEEAPARPPARSRPAPASTSTTVHIDLGSALKGAVAVAEFFCRRAAGKRAALKELEQTCLQLAAEYQGLVGVPDLLMRAECDRGQAMECLDRLEKASLCRYLCDYQEEALYVFPGFLPRQWECDYCGSKLPVPQGTPASTLCQCGSCGASMSQKILD